MSRFDGLRLCSSRTSYTMGGSCLLYLPLILLMRSGDIETNPGPNTSTVSNEEYLQLSKLIDASYYDDLGGNLEISYVLRDDIKERFKSNSVALMRVFMKWREKQPLDTNIRAVLAEKLQESGLVRLSGKLLDGSLNPNMASQPPLTAEPQAHQPLSPELVQKCAEDFKFTYQTSLCQIRADPLNPDSLVQFEDMYTHLVLEEERGGTKQLLEYSDLLNLKFNGKFPSRLLVQGEAGAGKTTFCAKIAWDWINGKYFQKFKWVIIVPLREYKQRTIGEIAKSYLPENNPATAGQLTEYMRSNTDKVFIVFDGLDEFKGVVTQPKVDGSKSTELQSQAAAYSTDSSKHQSKQGSTDGPSKRESMSLDDKDIEIVEILRSEKLRDCPVMVTTRPWKASEIRWNDRLRKMYCFLFVEGFSKEHLAVYIRKYFAGDEAKANNLIQFAGDNDVISENMAPYPIYVAMLCLMWKEFDEERQEIMKSLQTFSQIFQEMILFLKEHYAQKLVTQSCSLDDSLNDHLEEIEKLLKPIASLAFNGLLQNTLVFTEADFEHCPEHCPSSMQTACRVGVLSQENIIIPRERRRNRSSQRLLSTAFFPHKLFQEFMAGMHLASLYGTDNKEYNRLMKEVLVPRKEEFRYLLYFTSSESPAVGMNVMANLSRTYGHGDDKDFLVDVAFECHDTHAATSVKDQVLRENATLKIHDRMTAHTVAGYAFVGTDMVTLIVDRPCGPTMSHDIAELICSSPSLTDVDIGQASLHGNFYNRVAAKGEFSMVQSLSLGNVEVSAPASAVLVAGLCAMPHLSKLFVSVVHLNDEFCSTLRTMASSMKVQSLSLGNVEVSAPASAVLVAGLCAMPHLSKLFVSVVHLNDEFCSTLRTMASSMKVKSLSLDRVQVSVPASADLAAGLCAMPHLSELVVNVMPLHDEFCSTLRTMASSIKVQSLSLEHAQVSASASTDLAAGMCAMPHLSELSMEYMPFHDEFYSTFKAKASSVQVQSLSLKHVEVSAPASTDLASGLCAMPHLSELVVNVMPLHDEFCSTLRTMASSMKVQSFTLIGCRLSAPASADLAAALCAMTHLSELSMEFMPLHDGFCSTLRAMTSSMKDGVPPISKGNFKFNGISHESLQSWIRELPMVDDNTPVRVVSHAELSQVVTQLHARPSVN